MTEDLPRGRLFEVYQTYFGEPDRETDVYFGFALFFGGLGLGLGAFVVAAAGQWIPTSDFLARELAFTLGMVALPTTVGSLIVLLPVGKRGVYGGAAGAVVCGAGVAGFLWAYPYRWAAGGGPKYAIPVMLVYGLGLVSLLASTGAALVAYHVDRARPSPADFEPEQEEDQGESFSEEEIRQDIDEAMEEVDITWGGVEAHEGSDLKIKSDVPDLDTSGMDVDVERVQRSGVDDQVSGLKALKGGDKKTARSESTVDDQTDALQQLRERRREEEETADEETVLEGVLGRLSNLVRGR